MTGSSEELADLKAAYMTHNGDVDRILTELRCCTVHDIERHCDTLQKLIDSREVTLRRNFTRSSAELRRRAAAAAKQVYHYTVFRKRHPFCFFYNSIK